jgi:hypothetical protein
MLEGVIDLWLKVGLGVLKQRSCLTPHEGLSMVSLKLRDERFSVPIVL